MSIAFDLPEDPLADRVDADTQRQAARLVQEAFAAAYRLAGEGGSATRTERVRMLAGHLGDWADMSARGGRPARFALLLAGLDQWGLAYSQTFGPEALGGVSALILLLRERLGIGDEGACQTCFEQVQRDEAAALRYKIELRRALHLALWHSMVATEDRAEAEALQRSLGGLLLGLAQAMPEHGWRLVADALALVQIRCLSEPLAAGGTGGELTVGLFAALSRELPEHLQGPVMAHAAETVLAWRAAQGGTRH